MIGRIAETEVIHAKDGVNEFITVSAAAIQSIVGQGGGSTLTIQADANDVIVVSQGDIYTINAAGSVYTFYSSDPTQGGASQIAQVNVSTV
jgi:hypothetical protein